MDIDCLIVGGGPAGSALGSTLARWGRSVVLVHDRTVRRLVPEETLVAGSAERLDRAGFGGVLDSIEHAGSLRQGSVWSTDEVGWRSMEGAAQQGMKIDRDAFDTALRDEARRHGVRVLFGRAHGSSVDAPGEITVRTDDGETQLSPRVVVGATGRATLDWIPCRDDSRAPQLVALSSHVIDPMDLDATVIESVPAGWLWWLPLHPGPAQSGGVHLTLFVDGDELRRVGAPKLWEASLAAARGPARGVRVQGSRGIDATPYLRRSTGGSLLVGDAACRIDPLSSQGVEKALSSAEDCAYAVNTILESPELSSLVREHRFHWEKRLFEAHTRQTLAFYRREERFSEQPFWRTRHLAFDALDAGTTPSVPEILAPHPALMLAPVLVRRDRRFAEAPGFRTSMDAAPLERVGTLGIAPIVELVGVRSRMSDVMRRAPEHPDLFALSSAAVARGIAELVRLGFLVDAEHLADISAH